VGEFLGFVRSQTVGGADADLSILMDEWRAANDHIRSLEEREAGLADDAPIVTLPSVFKAMAEAVIADPMFKRSFAFVPARLRMVELDRLVVYQKHINLEFVQNLKQQLGRTPAAADVFNVCLPVDRKVPPTSLQQIAQNVYMFVSPSNDLRFVEAMLLKPQNVTGYAAVGPLVAVLGLAVGFSSNYLQAVEVEKRLVLHNGSHRAYALRELGVTHVPCVVQTVSRREELEVVGSRELQEEPDRYLREKRPPLLKDYFDPRLRKIVRVPRLVRQVKLTFGLESIDTPAA
jgi:hypothetical protein